VYKKAGIFLLLSFILLLIISPVASFLRNKPALLAVVRSWSMEPALTRGDLVFILPTGENYNYRYGQVVVFRSREYGISDWTMHRIVGGDPENGFITRSDANRLTDQDNRYPFILPAWIAGVVPSPGNCLLKVPIIGYALLFFAEYMKNPFLFSMLLSILALFILWQLEPDKKTVPLSDRVRPTRKKT